MTSKQDLRKSNFKSTGSDNRTDKAIKISENTRKIKREQTFQAKRVRVEVTSSNEEDGSSMVESVTPIIPNISLEVIFDQLKSTQPTAALRALRQLLSSPEPPIQQVIDAKMIVVLSNFLLSQVEEHQVDAAWCLSNIASGTHEQTRHVVASISSITMLFKLGCSIRIKEQVCWIVGNIAGDSDEFRKVLISNGCLSILINFLLVVCKEMSSGSGGAVMGEAVRTAAWALSNLTRGKTLASVFISTGSIPFLIELLLCDDSAVVIEICWLFAFLTAKEVSSVHQLIELGLVEALLRVAVRVDEADVTTIPLVRCLGNLARGPSVWMEALFSPHNTSVLVESLIRFTSSTSHREVVKEALGVTGDLLRSEWLPAKQILLRHNLQLNTTTDLNPLPLSVFASTAAAAAPVSLLSNVLLALSCGQFELEREALLCLTAAFTDSFTVSFVLAEQKRSASFVLAVLGLLRVQADADVVMGCINIVSVLYELSVASSNSHYCEVSREVVRGCMEMMYDRGLTDALDDLQYTSNNEVVSSAASKLVDKMYASMEAMEQCEDEEVQQQQELHFGRSEVVSSGGGGGRGSHMAQPSWMNHSSNNYSF